MDVRQGLIRRGATIAVSPECTRSLPLLLGGYRMRSTSESVDSASAIPGSVDIAALCVRLEFGVGVAKEILGRGADCEISRAPR
jgi:hypothetical protein